MPFTIVFISLFLSHLLITDHQKIQRKAVKAIHPCPAHAPKVCSHPRANKLISCFYIIV